MKSYEDAPVLRHLVFYAYFSPDYFLCNPIGGESCDASRRAIHSKDGCCPVRDLRVFIRSCASHVEWVYIANGAFCWWRGGDAAPQSGGAKRNCWAALASVVERQNGNRWVAPGAA